MFLNKACQDGMGGIHSYILLSTSLNPEMYCCGAFFKNQVGDEKNTKEVWFILSESKVDFFTLRFEYFTLHV